MIISEKDIMMLYQIVVVSLSYPESMAFSLVGRQLLVDKIMDQQSEELKQVGELEEEK